MFLFKWLKTPNIYSTECLPDILKSISTNATWNVSEKLDGCHISLSSKGYVASRNMIYAEEKDILKVKFEGVGLRNVQPLFEKIRALKQHFQIKHQLNVSELLCYGEFILSGTSSSKFDIYDYKHNNVLTGHCYIFSLGFVFDNENNDENKAKLQQHFSNVIQMKNDQGTTYFLCLINRKNRHFLLDLNISTVPIYAEETFVKIFTKSKYKLIEKLENRKLEGFILHDDTHQIFKFKYPSDYKCRNSQILKYIKNNFLFDDAKKIATSLESLFDYNDQYITHVDFNRIDELFGIAMYSKDTLYENIKTSNNIQFTIHCYANEILEQIYYAIKNENKFLIDKRVSMKLEDYIEKKLQHFVSHCL